MYHPVIVPVALMLRASVLHFDTGGTQQTDYVYIYRLLLESPNCSHISHR